MPMRWPGWWLPPASDTLIRIGRTSRFSRKLPGECSVRQIELLRFVFAALERLQIPYAVVGSFASGAWGEPRMTRDIDVVIRVKPSQVEQLCAAFPQDDFYVSRSAAEEAVRQHGPF